MAFPAVLDSIFCDPEFSGPLGDCQALAIPFDPVGLTPVSVLFERISPAAILRRIALRIIDAINGMLRRRSRSHIGIEIREFFPPLGNRQSDGSVSRIKTGLRVATALDDVSPDTIFGTCRESVFTVGQHHSSFVASARSLPSMQGVSAREYGIAASASAFPKSDLIGIEIRTRRSTDYGELSVNMTGSVNDWSSHTRSITQRRSA